MVDRDSEAYAALVALIRDGAFSAGQPMRADHLARLTGFSRTPIREALHRLAAERIVELHHHRGARLARLTRNDATELFELRLLIEPYAARLAAKTVSPPLLDTLESLQDKMEAALAVEDTPSQVEATALNNAFHSAILEASRSQLMVEVMRNASREPLLFSATNQYFTIDHMRQLYHEHRTIIAAIKARRPEWAAAEMYSHLEHGRFLYLDALPDD